MKVLSQISTGQPSVKKVGILQFPPSDEKCHDISTPRSSSSTIVNFNPSFRTNFNNFIVILNVPTLRVCCCSLFPTCQIWRRCQAVWNCRSYYIVGLTSNILADRPDRPPFGLTGE